MGIGSTPSSKGWTGLLFFLFLRLSNSFKRFRHLLIATFCVSHGYPYITVAERLRDESDIAGIVEEVRRIGMSEKMRMQFCVD